MITRIHVNQHVIRANRKTGAREAPITVKRGLRKVLGPCTVVYSPDKPLSCGATVWVETVSPVWVNGEVLSSSRNSLQRAKEKAS